MMWSCHVPWTVKQSHTTRYTKNNFLGHAIFNLYHIFLYKGMIYVAMSMISLPAGKIMENEVIL